MNNDLRVYLIRGVDLSLIGYVIDGWEVKSICATSVCDSPIKERAMFNILRRNFLQSEPYLWEYCGDINNPKFIYLFKQTTNWLEACNVITALRLYKLSEIGMSYPLFFNQAGGCIVNISYDYHNMHFREDVPLFSLTEEERRKIQEFYVLVSKPQTDHIQQMIQLFHEAYRNHNRHIAFIMRVTILEMLIEGNAELVFRLSRSVAVLLGRDKTESQEIFNHCKKIYSARSTFLHDGRTDRITPEAELLALDYSRRVIANLICIEKDIKEVRKTLDICGFGDDPYKVQF